MKIENGALVSEIWPQGTPANYGNSMAETGRLVHMMLLLDKPYYNISLAQFSTFDSYIETTYPLYPSSWSVSSDQCLPWYLATNKLIPAWADSMHTRIKDWGYKTPDGNYVTPMFYALLLNNKYLLNLFALAQALIFKIPFRWNDSTKSFTSSANSTADYLNWTHCAVYCTPWVRNLVNGETLLNKITLYYKPTDNVQEPNCQWILDLYKQLIRENWK